MNDFRPVPPGWTLVPVHENQQRPSASMPLIGWTTADNWQHMRPVVSGDFGGVFAWSTREHGDYVIKETEIAI